jgi:hypothetical protein
MTRFVMTLKEMKAKKLKLKNISDLLSSINWVDKDYVTSV